RKRIRRRALRQGLFYWHLYKDLAVPDFPTSAGENARITPEPFRRVPEEQILVPAKRTRRLFTGMDLGIDGSVARKIIRRSFMDLEYPAEVEEFGIAVYMDRPLGFSKTNNEPDQTPLLSYELFSKSLVLNRLQFLRDHPALGPAAAPVP